MTSSRSWSFSSPRVQLTHFRTAKFLLSVEVEDRYPDGVISLLAKQINHGQSEIRLEDGNTRIVATNAIRNCVQKSRDPEYFKAFWGGYPGVGGEPMRFEIPEDAAIEYGLIR